MKQTPRTTDLETLEREGFYKFTWGDLTTISKIGCYAFGRYHPWKRQGSSVLTGEVDYETVCWHIWIDGNSTTQSAESLEEAMALAIAIRLDGFNSKAAHYFMKMVGGYKKEDL